MKESRIREALATMPADEACEALANEAFDNGGRDHITVVVLRVVA